MRTKIGTVVSAKQNKTLVVRVDHYVAHPKYKKRYLVSKKFYAHDEAGTAKEGEKVEIAETRPISKLKHWKLVQVIK